MTTNNPVYTDSQRRQSRAIKGRPRTWCSRLALVLAITLVTVGALAFRLPKLDLRPMHGDEANQAYKAGVLLETGVYRYDPNEHHGPTLYYLMLPIAWLTGARTFADTTEATFRVVPVLFGAGLVLLVLLVGDGLGRWASVWAAVLTAVSPALVFYSRYYIQETLLVFFTFAAIGTGWRYAQSKRAVWAVLAGASIGLMHATKETCVLAFAAMGGGLVLTLAWARLRDGRLPRVHEGIKARHVAAFVLAAIVVSVTLFSSFFTYATGPLDSIRAFMQQARHAGGAGTAGLHDKPWHYYLHILALIRTSSSTWWSEGLILALAVIGGVAVLASKGGGNGLALRRFLVFYTLLLTALYALIPYKTPWCLINFLHPMILLAGLGAASLVASGRFLPMRIVLAILLAAGILHLGVQAFRADFTVYSDHRNPYVYAHPVIGVRHLAERMDELAAVHPNGRDMLVRVIKPDGDYWPLPWYLRRFTHVGYWTKIPDNADAPVIITSPDIEAQLAPCLRRTYQQEYYGLRPGVLLLVYIDQDLWDAFMRTRS